MTQLKNHRLSIVLFVIFFFLLSDSNAQIVNIEKARHKDTDYGIVGNLAFRGSYLKNDNTIFTLNGLVDLQYKTKNEDIFLLLMDYRTTKSEDVDFQNAAFIHARYNHQFSELFRWEAFAQIQDNKVTLLKHRVLIGTGPRFKLFTNDNFKFYLASIPMYENELLLDDAGTRNIDWRLSNYLSSTIILSESTELSSTTYYQPKFDLWKDARIFSETKLTVGIIKGLEFDVSYLITHDFYPAEGAPKTLSQLLAGFSFEF